MSIGLQTPVLPLAAAAPRAQLAAGRLLPAVAVGLLCLAALVGFGLFGPLPHSTRLLAVRGLALIWLGLALPQLMRRRHWLGLCWALGLLAALGSSQDPLLASGWLLVLVTSLSPPGDPWRVVQPAGRALGLILGLVLTRQLFPQGFEALEGVWRRLIQPLPALKQSDLVPGVYASGFAALLAVQLLLVALLPGRLRWALGLVLGSLLGWLLALQFGCGAERLSSDPQSQLLGLSAGVSSVGALLVFLVAWWLPARSPSSPVGAPRRYAALVPAALLVGLGAGWCAWPLRAGNLPENPRVAFFNRGGLDWEVPRTGHFGPFSSGMFGLLPHALERVGCHCAWIDGAEELPGALEATDLLVVINCDHEWTPEQEADVAAWVHAGGRLLVLGDHTDVFGLMQGSNPLLARYGIGFRFDSAYPMRGSGLYGVLHCHPQGPRFSARGTRAPGLGIGASLTVAAPATALVSSDWAFSDGGERSNTMGSFLGNYSLDAGESVGSIHVVAGARHGAGLVLAFGDTSPFQNSSLSSSLDHDLAPLLRWLLSEPAPELGGPVLGLSWALWLGLLLMGIQGRFGISARAPHLPTAALLGLLLAAAGSAAWNGNSPAFSSGPIQAGDAVLARQHAQKFGNYDTEGSNIGPLVSNLRRAGLWVRHVETVDAAPGLEKASVVALVAPREPLSEGSVEALLAQATAGGLVLVAASAPDSAGLTPLLQRLGARISTNLLADTSAEDPVRFAAPYGVEWAEGVVAEPLAWIGSQAPIVRFPVGLGSVVVVGDTGFFSSSNLEGTQSHHRGTLAFLEGLLMRFGQGQPQRYARPHSDP
jgi:hypothetical protein